MVASQMQLVETHIIFFQALSFPVVSVWCRNTDTSQHTGLPYPWNILRMEQDSHCAILLQQGNLKESEDMVGRKQHED